MQTRTKHSEVDDARIMQLEGDLARLHGQMHRAQKLASLGTAAAMVAHEFNNIMTPLVAYAQYALMREDPELMAKALRTTLKQTAAALEMSDRILGLAGDAPGDFAAVSVRVVVDDAVACLCRDLAKDGITLDIDVDSRLKVRAQAGQLRQVLFNLLLNARDALEGRSGRISISAAKSDDETVRIIFVDTGCGIAHDELGSIFDTFVTSKAPSNGRGRRGTGLGLAICRQVINEHGGSIEVQSRVGEGTSFTIMLPAPR